MSLSKEITPHLPYLRRYARALTGSQASGDAYVVSTLESIVEDPKAFPMKHGVRVGLFRVFSKFWSSIAINRKTSDEAPLRTPSPLVRNLAALTPRSREAFLLKMVEGFSDNEIAAIMDVSLNEAVALEKECGKEMMSVSCTRSSASARRPVMAAAKARR